ncbi:mutS protein homolog 5-like [Anopheles aquasalis]|uniref:mutS protein homolog 5-like n=1 Tax=Anopheles aquasalis TaxID=42839 RepID=UPI00215A8B11|nr:mutS protein homolog 5-like [Anopheles aquasalis]
MEEHEETVLSGRNPAGKILSLCWNAGALAASYYDIDQLELYAVQQAIEPRPQYVLLRELVRRYNPLFYLISGPTCFLDDCGELLRVPTPAASEQAPGAPTADDNNITTTSTGNGPHIKIHEFNARSQAIAKRRLLALKLPGMPRESDESECRTFLESILPFEQELLVHSVGNLLLLLDGIGESLSPDRLVTKINLETPSTQLIIDGLTYEALQIFDASRHPSGFKCGTTESRGMSVYSLFNKCASRNGEQWLVRLMTQPIRDRDELHRRHETVQWLLENIGYANQLEQYLKHLSNLGLLYRRILQGSARNEDWKAFKKNLYYLYSLCKLCALTLDDPKVAGTLIDDLGRYVRNHDNALKQILFTIDKCLDLERGAEENKLIIRTGLDRTIDQLREQYDGLRRVVLESSRVEMQNLQLDLANICVTYLPSFGFVISTQIDEQLHRSGLLENTSFELVFQADATAYFQIQLCKELNTEFGVMIGQLIEQELAFQTRLISSVGHRFPEVMGVFKDAGKLDALLSFATIAKMYRYVRPCVGEDKTLQIGAGRHVMLEHRRDYQAHDTDVGVGANEHYVNVIAADSTIGKTTYLKELATICYLAHIGSFVPADCARIPLLDSIYTRLDHPESIFSGRSSFMSELYQMALVLQNSSSRSLVLIDEFGKGTNYIEGKALLIASIEHLAKRQQDAPITFVTTRFARIGEFLPRSHRFLRVTQVARTGARGESETSRNVTCNDTTSVDVTDPNDLLETAYQLASRAIAFTLLKLHLTGGRLPEVETVRTLFHTTPVTRVIERCLEISHPPAGTWQHANNDVNESVLNRNRGTSD